MSGAVVCDRGNSPRDIDYLRIFPSTWCFIRYRLPETVISCPDALLPVGADVRLE